MRVKGPQVKFHDMSPQILFAIIVADGVYREHGAALVITSLNDSGHVHRAMSLHAIGHAVDLRTHNLDLTSTEKYALAEDIWARLGGREGQFDVILEGVGSSHEHLHIEYQPHRAVIEERSNARNV